MKQGRISIVILGIVLAFAAGFIFTAPPASAASPVLNFLETTVVTLLNDIQATVSGNDQKLDTVQTDLDTIEGKIDNIELLLASDPDPICGNGTLELGEACDDGNNVNGDGCSATCNIESTATCEDVGLNTCGGICSDLQNDEANCGSCGSACSSGEFCSAGNCQLVCPTGLSNCSGICVDMNTDENHCGACANACSSGELCGASICQNILP